MAGKLSRVRARAQGLGAGDDSSLRASGKRRLCTDPGWAAMLFQLLILDAES